MKIGRKQQDVIGRLIVIISLLSDTFFVGFPIFRMICSSLKLSSETFAFPPEVITKNSSFDTYISVFKDFEKLRFFANSYFIAGMVVTLTLLVAIPTSYAFNRCESPRKKIINIFIVPVQATPPITLLVPYFGLMVALRFYNAYQGPIFTYVVLTPPYAVVMLAGCFDTLPREFDEATKVDEGTSFGALWKILVPISIPGILSVAIYTFMITWSEYLFALTLARANDMRTVPTGIQLLMGQHSYDWNGVIAMNVLGSIPVTTLFIFFQQYFISGMTSDSVKS